LSEQEHQHKKKKNSRPRLGMLPFIAIWSAAYALGWGVPLMLGMIIGTIAPILLVFFPLVVLLVALVAIPGLSISLAQHVLLPTRTGQEIHNWWWVSSLGWLVSGVIFTLNFSSINFNDSDFLKTGIIVGVIFLPPAVLQMLFLWKYVHRAWIWPLAAFVSGILFVLPTLGSTSVEGVLLLAGSGGLLQGLVMGLVLLWLFSMPKADAANLDIIKDEAAIQPQRKLWRDIQS